MARGRVTRNKAGNYSAGGYNLGPGAQGLASAKTVAGAQRRVAAKRADRKRARSGGGVKVKRKKVISRAKIIAPQKTAKRSARAKAAARKGHGAVRVKGYSRKGRKVKGYTRRKRGK